MDGTPNILVLTGDPGFGKSALLGKFTRDLSEQPSDIRHSSFVFPHFIGASTGSTDLRRTLRRLCHELARAGGSTEPLPLDIKELITQFHQPRDALHRSHSAAGSWSCCSARIHRLPCNLSVACTTK